MAIVFAALGSAVVALGAVVGLEVITWDVKGRLLTGATLWFFALVLGLVGLLALAGAYGLWRGRLWGRWLCLAFWVAGALVALVTDRSVAGPGEPLRTYLVDLMLVPAGATWLLLWVVPAALRKVSAFGE